MQLESRIEITIKYLQFKCLGSDSHIIEVNLFLTISVILTTIEVTILFFISLKYVASNSITPLTS